MDDHNLEEIYRLVVRIDMGKEEGVPEEEKVNAKIRKALTNLGVLFESPTLEGLCTSELKNFFVNGAPEEQMPVAFVKYFDYHARRLFVLELEKSLLLRRDTNYLI